MNNENNNYNGQILGSVDNSNLNNNMNVSNELESLETLDMNTQNSTPNPSFMYTSDMNNNANVNSNINNQNMGSSVLNGQTLGQNTVSNPVPPQVERPVQVEPAYTNPQSINSMPGFESSSTIGTTPPISLEAEKQPKQKKSNKTLFVIIVIILLFGVGFGTYYVLNYTDLLSKAPKVEITTNDLEINLGENLPESISDYANVVGTDIKSCILNTLDVDVNTAGSYTYQVTCGEVNKKGTINVIDNRELEVDTETVYKVKGDTIEVQEFITNIDNSYTYEFVNTEEVNNYLNGESGTYNVKIKVSNGTKTSEVEGKLVILEHKIIGYLTCSSKEQILSGSSTKKIVREKFAIVGDGNNGFGKVASEIHEFKFNDETEYTNYVASYKTNNTLTIDNVTGKVDFDNDTLTITITNDVTESELISKYGESNITNYRSIRNYFLNTLGYECTYKKIES